MSIEDEVRRSLKRRVEAVSAEPDGPRIDRKGLRRPTARIATIAFALLLGVASIAFLLSHESIKVSSESPTPTGTREFRLNPGIGRIVGGFGSIWVVEPSGVARIDPKTGDVTHIAIDDIVAPNTVQSPGAAGYTPRETGSGITVGSGKVWVTTGRPSLDAVGIDPKTDLVETRVPLGQDGITNIAFDGTHLMKGAMAEGGGYLDVGGVRSWPVGVGEFPLVMATGSWYWAGGESMSGTALERMSKDDQVDEAIAGVASVDSMTEANGYVWVTGGNWLYQIDESYGGPPASPQSVFPKEVDAVVTKTAISGPGEVASDGTSLWLLQRTGEGSSSVTKLDPSSGASVGEPIELAHSGPGELTVLDGTAWVSFQTDGTVAEAEVISPSSAQTSETPSPTKVVLPIPPDCVGGAPPSSHLTLATEKGSHMALVQDCVYAPADTRFTITFKNQTVVLGGSQGPPENLSIYRNQEEAISITPSGKEWAIDRSKALFVGDEVPAPGTITYEVPPLPAGTYYVQSDFAADLLVATLVVE
jgi:hypothetical protein